MKRIAVFENEKSTVEGAFKVFNILYYNSQLDIKYFPSSQDGEPFSQLSSYDAIIVDIELSIKSKLDGFNLINSILPIVGKDKILIMTGFSKTEDKLREYGLPNIPILPKPVTFTLLNEILSPLLK